MLSFKNNDPIVVSGMSGKVANSDNLTEFQEQVYNKKDMVTMLTRFQRTAALPERIGTIPTIEKFDNAYFGVPNREVEYMDPSLRMMHETVCEALHDAGLNLEQIKGTRTGIYVGHIFNDSEASFYNETPRGVNAIMGSYKGSMPMRLAHFFQIQGPSYICDSACSSSLYAMHHAISDLEDGKVDYAIVCGTSLLLKPEVTKQFYRLGVLSNDGACKSFDDAANGYVRSDGNLCAILQRSSVAKRNYAELVHSLINCDGFKEMGITFPSGELQKALLYDFYDQCKIPFDEIGFVEAHGTGTKVGDPVELQIIEEVYCKTLKEPLLIGSVKSNVGHSEGASGLTALAKVCMIFESGIIPPNINYKTPNRASNGLKQGKMVVVTEPTPLPPGKPYVSMSNFGFGGANSHVLLKRPTIKPRPAIDEELPRLLCVSGRTFEAVESYFKDVKKRPYDPDFVALLNASFNIHMQQYNYRGYAIVKKTGVHDLEIINNMEPKMPLKCFFHVSGITKIAPTLLKFVAFKYHLQQVQKVLKMNKIDWDCANLTNNNINSVDIFTTVVVQTGIVNMLKVLNVEIAEFMGTGIGEISASYADGVIQLDQAILAAHRINKLMQAKQADVKMVSKELESICNMVQKPQKWKLGGKVNGNLAHYFADCAFKPKAPLINQENLLIIGGDAISTSNIVSLCDKNADNGFLHSLGRLYMLGYSLELNTLYSVTWPVKQNTPMISPLVKWKHHKTWAHLKYKEIRSDVKNYSIKLNDAWESLKGHIIDGRILFPATGYIYLVWELFESEKEEPVVFENVKFLRACTVPAGTLLQLQVQIYSSTGYFEITEGHTLVVTGYVKIDTDFDTEWIDLPQLPRPKPEDMLTKRDIYKEMGLRGYYYQGDFKEIQCCDLNATVGDIRWTNWISFMDTMLQIKILQYDTRSLFVPTKISKLTLNPSKHLEVVYGTTDVNNVIIPINHYKDLDLIRCGFIEIRGLCASGIVKRKLPTPVLEANIFVPYVANLDIKLATRVLAQIALENFANVKVKAIEMFKDAPDGMEPLLPYIQDALNDQPLIQPDFTVISTKELDLGNVTVVDKDLATETGHVMAVGCNLLENAELRTILLATLKPGGYLISRESLTSKINDIDLTILCEYTTDQERIVMLRVVDNKLPLPKPIHISEKGFKWLEPIKEARLKKQNLLLYAENEPNNGIMGLTNCVLRESGGEKVMNVWVDDKSAPPFDVEHDFYKRQLEKRLSINVFQNGTWGSYRHMLLSDNYNVQTVHSYVNNTVRGDLSSLAWMQGNLSIPENYNANLPGTSRVHIYAAALNFRDVMVASGKITLDSVSKERKYNQCLLGIEFSGRKENGQRVMGFWESGAMANLVQVSDDYLWEIPHQWTMAEAATTPAVYATNIYGLIIRAQMVAGESILIHSATGGIGLSAINIALHYKCNIFLTVGTQEKRDFILKHYPQIPESHIGNSRDTSFYEMVLRETNGAGVDLILNSLADEKLQASVRCLGDGGRFVEIGKFDLTVDSLLSIELASKNGEYHGVMLDNIMSNPGSTLKDISDRLCDGIIKGYIKPIPKNCFNRNELETAFRHMTTGKHIGKIVINVRDEESDKLAKPEPLLCDAKPRFYCNPKGSYIILGGLGGFGLELADLLALRGARNIVLVSRKGLSTGYQKLRLQIWDSYKCNIAISQHNTSTLEGCQDLINMAQALGDVCGIFNLAVVLKDALLENQTEDTFLESYNPKAQATIYLDQIARKMLPKLEHFIVFSSVSCGRGNAGQTNYGYSNSVMERVCENRRKDGLPAKAIQWGVIGDVGIVADFKEQNIEIVIGGTMHQRIANCLEVLDLFMLNENAIVSSMVVAEKKYGSGEADMLKVVLELLQIKDIKMVSPMSSFPELGMDSMMGVEIKQTLEREFDVFLSPQELRTMTFARLTEIANGERGETATTDAAPMNVENLMQFVPTEEECDIPLVIMQDQFTNTSHCLYLFPGIEGMSTVFVPMMKQLPINAKCLQFCYESTADTIADMAREKLQILEKELKRNEPFTIAAHSVGSSVALEVVTMLEKKGYSGTLVLIDGSPLFGKRMTSKMFPTTKFDTEFEIVLIFNIVASILPMDIVQNIDTIKQALIDAKSFEERCTITLEACPEKLSFTNKFLHRVLMATYRRIKAEMAHEFTPRKYTSRIVLCRAAMPSLPDLPEDYGLRAHVGNDNLEIHEFPGNHVSMIENEEFVKCLESIIKST